MTRVIFFTLCAVGFVSSIFVCPNSPITSGSGKFPASGNLEAIPQNTSCTITFNIPQNQIVTILIASQYNRTAGDDLLFSENDGLVYRLMSSTTGLKKVGTPGTVKLNITGVTGTSQVLVSYAFENANNYPTITSTTGDYFQLSLKPKTFYTITASINDKVALSVGHRNTATEDPVLQDIYVFDGSNMSSPLGRIANVVKYQTFSSSRTITLVNLYNTTSELSFVLANDASKIAKFSKYLVVMTSSNTITNGQISDASLTGAAYTFICTDCTELYLTKLDFDSFKTFNNSYAAISGMSPTQNLPILLNYTAMQFTSNNLPQVIQSSMFTLQLYLSGVTISVSTTSDSFNAPYDGRKGSIFNPAMWNPLASPNYVYTFRNSSQLYKYSVDLSQMDLVAKTDLLDLTIGTDEQNPAVHNIYQLPTSGNGKVESNGNFMRLTYTGSPSAKMIVTYEMKITSSSSALGFITSILIFLLVSI